MTVWQLDKTQQMYEACKERSLWSHDFPVNINTGHGPVAVSKDFPKVLQNFCPLICDVVKHPSSFDLNWAEWYAFSIFWSLNWFKWKHHVITKKWSKTSQFEPNFLPESDSNLSHPAGIQSFGKKRRSISCKISEDLDFDFLDMKTCGLFPHSGFNHDLKKDMSCFFRLGLLIEFDGLIDSEAVQMWQIFGAVQFFKVRSCTQDAVDICGLQERYLSSWTAARFFQTYPNILNQQQNAWPFVASQNPKGDYDMIPSLKVPQALCFSMSEVGRWSWWRSLTKPQKLQLEIGRSSTWSSTSQPETPQIYSYFAFVQMFI